MSYQTSLRITMHGVLFAMLLGTSQLYAATLAPAARGEIEGLLSRLAASGCQFKRNGSWHTAEEAQAHLRRKLDYLEERSAVANTEQFIQRAATKSSMSGKPYQVRCGSETPVPSSQWLHSELQTLRGAKH
ncbi:MAG: YfeK family protein [Thiobacillus sp.]